MPSNNPPSPPLPSLTPPIRLPQSNTDSSSEKQICENVLNVIGQCLKEDRSLAPVVHSSFAIRWEEVLTSGLPKKEKDLLIKKYSPPKNCTFLDHPKLNPEVASTVNETERNRDKRIIAEHEKLVTCIAGVNKTLTVLLTR